MSESEHERRLRVRDQRVLALLDLLESLDLEVADVKVSSAFSGSSALTRDLRYRRCEHCPAWQHGRLCLACDNTGNRRATEQERRDGMAEDLYLLDPPTTQTGTYFAESESARRAQRSSAMDSEIERLRSVLSGEREERLDPKVVAVVRADATERRMRKASRSLPKIAQAIEQMPPALRTRLRHRDPETVRWIATNVVGKLYVPPFLEGVAA